MGGVVTGPDAGSAPPVFTWAVATPRRSRSPSRLATAGRRGFQRTDARV